MEAGVDIGAVARSDLTPLLRDVAVAAGVSPTTASLILNGKTDNFAAATIERVRETALSLGYRPNGLARSLRRQRTHTIGVVSDQIATTPFAGAMIRGAQEAAWEAGHLLMLIDTDDDLEAEGAAIEALLERRVEGLIYARMKHTIVEVPPTLREVPATLLDARTELADLPSVVPDDFGGARKAMDHLLSVGHRRIGFVQTTDDVPAAEERFSGYRLALEEAGQPFDPELVVEDPHEGAQPVTALEDLLRSRHRPTALFAFNDRTAFGIYNTARRVGLAIPDDLSVVGFDNLEGVAGWLDPGLTTVQLPHYEMGRWAVEHLERLIGGERMAPEQFRMPCRLVRRASVCPPGET